LIHWWIINIAVPNNRLEIIMTGEIATGSKTHPLVIVAAGTVILLCVAAIASIMGWLPSAGPANLPVISAPPSAVLPGDPAAAPQMQTAPVAPAAAPAPQAKPQVAVAPQPPAPRPENRYTPSQPAATAPVPTYMAQSNPPPMAPAPVAAPAPEPRQVCTNCGTVSSVSSIEKQGEGSGAGAVLGGLLGGVVGHQVGSGRGRDVATVAGAVGGALVGNQVEKSNKRSVSYDVRVHMEDGSYRTVHYATEPGYRTGDKVRIENGRLAPR
jgi:uncharacterized protein YcfJ